MTRVAAKTHGLWRRQFTSKKLLRRSASVDAGVSERIVCADGDDESLMSH